MSLSANRWAWMVPNLKPAERLVLLCYADHANAHANAWPTNERVAIFTGLSRRTVQRALEALVDRRLLALLGRGGRSGYQAVFKVCGRALKGGEVHLWTWTDDPDDGQWQRAKVRHSDAPSPQAKVRHTGTKVRHCVQKVRHGDALTVLEPINKTGALELQPPPDPAEVFSNLRKILR